MLDFDKYRGRIADHLIEAMSNYVAYRYHPGSFLLAVLRNDLKGCVDYGDDECLKTLPDIVRLLVNEVPVQCWGSIDKVEAWLTRG